MSDSIDVSTGRFLNESAIHEHALRCSASFRANRFTRVGKDFVDEVRADVEAAIRAMRNSHPTQLHDPLSRTNPENSTTAVFTRGADTVKLWKEFNDLIARIIQNKVQRQPSCGKTLGRTR